jgi:hypothetical protein
MSMLLSTFVRDTFPHGLGVTSSCNVRRVNQSQTIGSCMLISGYWARNWEQKRQLSSKCFVNLDMVPTTSESAPKRTAPKSQ